MKRVLSILLMLVYTTASSGTVLSLHYCMGDLAGVSVGQKQSKQCNKCGMKDKHCCHDQPVVIKIENADIQQAAKVAFDLHLPELPRLIHIEKPSSTLEAPLYDPFVAHANGRPPSYVMHCVFRI